MSESNVQELAHKQEHEDEQPEAAVAASSQDVEMGDKPYDPKPEDEVPECCRTFFLMTGEPTGIEITIGGIPTYVARPENKSKNALLFITDIFGWKFVNNRLLADQFAKLGGFNVFVPDFFQGDAPSAEVIEKIVKPSTSFLEGLSKTVTVVTMIPSIVGFMYRHSDSKTLPLIDTVLQDLREGPEGIEKICSIGYCWGGRYSILLGSTDKVMAYSAAHPSIVSFPKEFQTISKIGLYCCAEQDNTFPPKKANDVEKLLKDKPFPTIFRHYPGTRHGFGTRGNDSDEVVKKARDDAFQDALSFFKDIFNGQQPQLPQRESK